MIERKCSKSTEKCVQDEPETTVHLHRNTQTTTIFAKEPEWFSKLKQIKVTESTRQDVERIFGFPKVKQVRNGKWNQMIDYDLNVGRFEVSYSTGKCSQEKNKDGYNLDEGIVLEVYLFLFEAVKISKLRLDLTNFEKYEGSDTNSLTYNNDELGIEYIGDKKTITSIKYAIGEKYDFLDCKNVLMSK